LRYLGWLKASKLTGALFLDRNPTLRFENSSARKAQSTRVEAEACPDKKNTQEISKALEQIRLVPEMPESATRIKLCTVDLCEVFCVVLYLLKSGYQ
jgi:hypothetical protein